mmetsp:Transcript_78480/g.155969  ORF Transcript_78480/g.155969 Transcript_78480/m.155969 type:complete len:243 (-) Transcript_78480:144-872(-)
MVTSWPLTVVVSYFMTSRGREWSRCRSQNRQQPQTPLIRYDTAAHAPHLCCERAVQRGETQEASVAARHALAVSLCSALVSALCAGGHVGCGVRARMLSAAAHCAAPWPRSPPSGWYALQSAVPAALVPPPRHPPALATPIFMCYAYVVVCAKRRARGRAPPLPRCPATRAQHRRMHMLLRRAQRSLLLQVLCAHPLAWWLIVRLSAMGQGPALSDLPLTIGPATCATLRATVAPCPSFRSA